MSITVTREYYDFNNLRENSWSGASEWLEEVSIYNLEDEFMEWLEDVVDGKCLSEAELNDIIWFETANWMDDRLKEQPSEYENIIDYMNFRGMSTEDLEGSEWVETIAEEFNTVSEFIEEYENYDSFADMKKAIEGEEE